MYRLSILSRRHASRFETSKLHVTWDAPLSSVPGILPQVPASIPRYSGDTSLVDCDCRLETVSQECNSQSLTPATSTSRPYVLIVTQTATSDSSTWNICWGFRTCSCNLAFSGYRKQGVSQGDHRWTAKHHTWRQNDHLEWCNHSG